MTARRRGLSDLVRSIIAVSPNKPRGPQLGASRSALGEGRRLGADIRSGARRLVPLAAPASIGDSQRQNRAGSDFAY
jgi:hypothetical protein